MKCMQKKSIELPNHYAIVCFLYIVVMAIGNWLMIIKIKKRFRPHQIDYLFSDPVGLLFQNSAKKYKLVFVGGVASITGSAHA